MFTQKKITFDRLIRGIISGTIIIAILFLLDRLSGVLLPFFIAWLIAYLMYPMVIFYQTKLHLKSRVVSILAVMLTLAVVITGACLVFVPPMIEECSRLKQLIELYFTEGSGHSAIPKVINNFLQQHISTDWLEQNLNTENLIKAVQGLAPKLWTLISTSYNIVVAILTFFIMVLYIFFILLDYEQIAERWVTLVPARHRKTVVRLMTDIKVSMNRYFRGQSLVAFCVGILFCIGFLIIDFPLAIPLGLFIGLLNMVPYLQIVGFIPTILLAILKAADTGESFWWIFCMALLVFAVVQMIQDGFLVPKIMGKITGLNPAIILLSLSIWGSLMGMLGMIIALPLTTLLLSYYQRYIHKNDLDFLSQQNSTDFQRNKEDQKKIEKKS
ncbi:AI-2E family transporter [uncultured Phocaeicola sp.]|uniref:AI-2E family transporter n=1 Tax=uncultured Phocaeicola sp. TaxID=990718 RepID=UPI0025F6065F|nr:AI-2E family transporter [uncultured Phocaeicola sp.]